MVRNNTAVLKERLNKIISNFPCVMIEQVDDKVYLLREHWKYLDWKKNAPRELIGKGQLTPNRFEYLTEKFPTFKRTKF